MLAAELIIRCFDARTSAHILHLESKSYSQHMALNTFYDEIVELADDFAETYQGQYGVIIDYPPSSEHYRDPIKLVDELADWVASNRRQCYGPHDTHLSNIVDEIVALARRTAYKLRNLK